MGMLLRLSFAAIVLLLLVSESPCYCVRVVEVHLPPVNVINQPKSTKITMADDELMGVSLRSGGLSPQAPTGNTPAKSLPRYPPPPRIS